MSFDAGGAAPEEEVFEDPNGGVPRARRGTGGDGGAHPDLDGTLEDAALQAVHGVATAVLRNSLVPFGLVPGPPVVDKAGDEQDNATPQEATHYEHQQHQQGVRDGHLSEDAPAEGGHTRGRREDGQQGAHEDEQLRWFGAPGSVDVVGDLLSGDLLPGDLLSGFLASGAGLVNDAARALTTSGLAGFPQPEADHDASFRRRRGRHAHRGDSRGGDEATDAAQDENEVPEELLEMAVEEGFQRAEAKACCLRVAAAYGVCPGDLSIDFAGDLVLQALTEERAHPGVLFVKPAAAVPLSQQHALRRRARGPRDGSGTDTASGGGWTSDASAFLSARAPAVAAVRARKRRVLLTCLDALQILVLGSLAMATVLLYLRGGPSLVGVTLVRESALRLSRVHFWSSAPTLSPTFLAAASGDVARLRAILNAARDAAAAATAHKAGRRREAEDISSAHHVQDAAMAAVAQDGAARGGRRARLGGSATPVAAAVSGGHGGALAALLAAGASVNEGVTLGPPFAPGLHISPLAIAAVHGHVACAAALLHAGADPDVGVTAYVLGLRIPLLRLSPLGLALNAGHGPVARALLRAGSHAHICGRLLAGNVQVPCLTAAAGATSQKQAAESNAGGKAPKTGAIPMGKPESSLDVLRSWHATSATASGSAGSARTARGSASTNAASSAAAAAAAAAAQQRAAAARHDVHGLAGSKQGSVVLQAARRAADAAHDAAVRAAAEAELAELESSRLAVVAADAAMVAAVERGVDGGEL